MDYAVGIDMGSACTIVAVGARERDGGPDGGLKVVETTPSVVFVDENGELLFGQDAVVRGAGCPRRVIRDVKSRIGDDVPVAVDSWSRRPEAIFAAAVCAIIDKVTAREGCAPAAITVTYPAAWGPYKRALVADALKAAGLADVLLVSDPQAAATHAAQLSVIELNHVAVYDLGASSFEVAVLSGSGATFEQLGRSKSLEWLGGSDLDQAVFSFVARSAGVKKVNDADSELVEALGRLRRSCVDAKEALSMDTETTIPVVLPRSRTRVRLVRSEFEDLIRDAIEDTVDATTDVIASAGLTVDDIDAVVMVGGSSRIPLVYQLISAEFGRPVIIDRSPEAATALGAARIALTSLTERRTSSGIEIMHVVEQPVSERQLVPLRSTTAEAQPGPDVDLGDSDRSDPADDLVPAIAGRHRLPSRRNWLRSAGWLAACTALVVTGSSLAASRAAEFPPGGSVHAESVDDGFSGSDGAPSSSATRDEVGEPTASMAISTQTAALLVAEVENIAGAFGDGNTSESSWSAADSTSSTTSSSTTASSSTSTGPSTATTATATTGTATSGTTAAPKPATNTPAAGPSASSSPAAVAPVAEAPPPLSPASEGNSGPETSASSASPDPTTSTPPPDPEPVSSSPSPTLTPSTTESVDEPTEPANEEVQTPASNGPDGVSEGG